MAIRCRQFILVSTVDVFMLPKGVDEHTAIEIDGLCPYGLHRYRLEQRTRELFPKALIVRLPGLVGPGLKKNVIFDLHHDNDLHAVDSRSIFQFYPLVNLWSDIETALAHDLSCVHLTAEPVSVHDVALGGFGHRFGNEVVPLPARYDMQTVHAAVYGSVTRYQYTVRETMLAVRAYAQTEPRRAPPDRF
jgi:hypothetical protein